MNRVDEANYENHVAEEARLVKEIQRLQYELFRIRELKSWIKYHSSYPIGNVVKLKYGSGDYQIWDYDNEEIVLKRILKDNTLGKKKITVPVESIA